MMVLFAHSLLSDHRAPPTRFLSVRRSIAVRRPSLRKTNISMSTVEKSEPGAYEKATSTMIRLNRIPDLRAPFTSNVSVIKKCHRTSAMNRFIRAIKPPIVITDTEKDPTLFSNMPMKRVNPLVKIFATNHLSPSTSSVVERAASFVSPAVEHMQGNHLVYL